MNVQEMVNELRASMGNRTDLTDARLVLWLNWAQYDLCGFHDKKIFTPLRFHELEQEVKFRSSYATANYSANGTTNTVYLSASGSADVGFYDGWILYDSVTGEYKEVDHYLGAAGAFAATLIGVLTTAPLTTGTYKLFQRKYDLEADLGLTPSELWVVERMEDGETADEIMYKEWQYLTKLDRTQTGAPAAFSRHGKGIIFDVTPDLKDDSYNRFFRCYCYRFPTLFTMVEMTLQESVIPIYWHEAIVLGAVYRGFGKLMEPDREDKALDDYLSCVRRKRTTLEWEGFNTRGSLKLRRE